MATLRIYFGNSTRFITADPAEVQALFSASAHAFSPHITHRSFQFGSVVIPYFFSARPDEFRLSPARAPHKLPKTIRFKFSPRESKSKLDN